MRESCTYGSMRGRACPMRGVSLYSTTSDADSDFRDGRFMILPLYLRGRQANCLSAFAPLPWVTLRTRPVTASRPPPKPSILLYYLRYGGEVEF